MNIVRPCRDDERAVICDIINAAAEAYRGVIPEDRWHDPYMSSQELDAEIAAGVTFWACESEAETIGVMGLQSVRDVDLIRHAYVRPGNQGRGVGAALITHLRGLCSRRMLVGTWQAATWAVYFYKRHGFVQVSPDHKSLLLRSYWKIPERQIETSVVLANPAYAEGSG
jgi:GNAT superfamily N-acetyltransferase